MSEEKKQLREDEFTPLEQEAKAARMWTRSMMSRQGEQNVGGGEDESDSDIVAMT